MKRISALFFTGVLMSVLCAGFVGCNDGSDGLESGLGEEIPGMEVLQVTGTVIGSFANGFSSLLVQIEEEFHVGETIDAPTPPARWFYTTLPETETGTYFNMIQVQSQLPVEQGDTISFSIREYRRDRDLEMFQLGGARDFGELKPDVPIYIVTDYEILND